MTSNENSLPSWEECDRKAAHNRELTALERFILDNEPCGKDDELFRAQLAAVVSEASAPETKPDAWMSSINPKEVTPHEEVAKCWHNPPIPLYRKGDV